jgi:Na+-translocating ferredoxin:NAD+ oxidoreductase RnfD subunit
MKMNNVYVRSKKNIYQISITRILLLLPMILYGVYKNGLFLYINKYTNLYGLFRPLIFIFGGAFIGAMVNVIYELIFNKKNNNNPTIREILFSSFHIEYGIILGCLVSINTNVLVFFLSVFGLLMVSKFFKNRVNIMCVIFITIYAIQTLVLKNFDYMNIYESNKLFEYNILDYIIGKNVGGIASTNILINLLVFVLLSVTNNTKTSIGILSMITSLFLFSVYCMFANVNIGNVFFQYGYIFIFTFVATDYVTSSYTILGMRIFGIVVGALTFAFYFVNPILAPFIAVLLTSFLNNLIDRSNKLFKK